MSHSTARKHLLRTYTMLTPAQLIYQSYLLDSNSNVTNDFPSLFDNEGYPTNEFLEQVEPFPTSESYTIDGYTVDYCNRWDKMFIRVDGFWHELPDNYLTTSFSNYQSGVETLFVVKHNKVIKTVVLD